MWALVQVFGKDSFLTLGRETEESRRAWADDADAEVRCQHVQLAVTTFRVRFLTHGILTHKKQCGDPGCKALRVSQEAPEVEELKTPAKRGREKDAILGVRLGAGGRSYMVQDKKIGVLRNMHGGVQVSRTTGWICMSMTSNYGLLHSHSNICYAPLLEGCLSPACIAD